MNAALFPLVSEFETPKQEASYTAWLRAKVESSLTDNRPPIPHDEVERRMTERLARLRERNIS
ncbi:stability determinant [Verminephrobacter aporrectodeae subsp. tuberculatae]|uniref:type II toxin-antitoxin system RelB family antitoxin n=1 Tax=Verminephrobacter aporrectodeae TaxID=1110389 RepID=UPI0022370C55|nr:stability determinant [Verminephrobacter aporrectodeae]MCW5222885.1 stability determinant [Verminephrobacter aporrectodeae subsp. tuberculatae]MCW5256897.1 stability determinant [Verminephrobacter aporrectodeae subsp. tuberculatae]MCW5288349.1 stability determinant [Verminephrobacter aporrectodeae subsp. tuberculatae]MCW8166481.1 stability determinant [Verminephrobacter aporrectodeae subsp. tuberculatae]MCW8170041.1 stability determinant [Verminephrobacter aporrectodeae subsp. tuberculatae]